MFFEWLGNLLDKIVVKGCCFGVGSVGGISLLGLGLGSLVCCL